MKKTRIKYANSGKDIITLIDCGYPGDLDYCRVSVSTKRGKNYLACEGGPRSAFGRYNPWPRDSWSGGEAVYLIESDDDKRRINRAAYFVDNRDPYQSYPFGVDCILFGDVDSGSYNWDYYFGGVDIPAII